MYGPYILYVCMMWGVFGFGEVCVLGGGGGGKYYAIVHYVLVSLNVRLIVHI